MKTDDKILEVALIAFIPFLVAFVFIIFLFYRQRREVQVKKEKAELQLRALRAQMNPHFIFNCLNSIYNSIQSGKSAQASNYLLKFSHLLRRVLENSDKNFVTLKEEIDMLETYLQLEKYRADDSFDYTISVDVHQDTDDIEVPMLLVQPIIENAIWHGVKTDRPSLIEVQISEKKGMLHFQIMNTSDDAAVVATGKSGHKSMGLTLVKDRLQTIQSISNLTTSIESGMNADSKYAVLVTIPTTSIA